MRSSLSSQGYSPSEIYFFFAAGLAFADFAGFLASVFLAATSFFAAISVAPLEKNSGTVRPELSSLSGTRKAEATQKCYTPTRGVNIQN